MKSYLPKRFDFRVRVFMEEPDFGKGVAQLLSLTREKGSLSAAYKSLEKIIYTSGKPETICFMKMMQQGSFVICARMKE